MEGEDTLKKFALSREQISTFKSNSTEKGIHLPGTEM